VRGKQRKVVVRYAERRLKGERRWRAVFLQGQHDVKALNLVRVTLYLQWGIRIQNRGDPH